jgi:uncharacterized protein YjbJ (UPF0337 family)
MYMTEDAVRGKWQEIKGDIQRTWGRITDDELNQTKGDFKALAGLVQQRYGLGKKQFDETLSTVLNRYQARTRNTTDSLKS